MLDSPSCVQHFISNDLDQHAQLQGPWQLHYEQLSDGVFEGKIQQVVLEDIILFREDTNLSLRQKGHLHTNSFGFAIALENKGSVFFNGRVVPEDSIMCGKGDQIDMVTPTMFTLLAIVVDKQLLSALWENLYQKPLALWLDKQLVLPTRPMLANSLRQQHLATIEIANSVHIGQEHTLKHLRDEILIEWIESIPPQVDTNDYENLNKRKQLVDKACELMLSRPDEPPTILEICSHLSVSRRKLNYYFQDVLGETPNKYLRVLRLNCVRRDLKSASVHDTVQNIAMKWGFWHLSQFAQDYKALFLELPSSTLKNN
jgi:AraC family ethanolamine operon transcriptional activator